MRHKANLRDTFCALYAIVHNIGAGGVNNQGQITRTQYSHKRLVQADHRSNARIGYIDMNWRQEATKYFGKM